MFFFFKQKTAYEMRISDWSSDVCSSDLVYDDEGRSAFLAQQISQIYEHRLISHFYPGMLCAAQSSVHRDDLAEAVVRLVDRRHALPSALPLLIGEPDAPGYAEIQDIVSEATHGSGCKPIRTPHPPAQAGTVFTTEATA